MGRTKLWPVRILVPMTKEMQSRLDAVTGEGEARLDVIREGIEREIKRRGRLANPGKTPKDSAKPTG